jgi:hypothetical protein
MAIFFDRRLQINVGLTLISSVIVLLGIKTGTTIHLPYAVTLALAAGLGFREPRKGWMLAIAQSLIIYLAFQLLVPTPDSPGDGDVEAFGLYGSIILTFIGSGFSGLMKRNLDQ